ncbi:MAG: hypothetical protein DI582_03530 [Azospirillum brasilense]|nr:MAG: hypothetical protein DI582_03530 [Azospirillum brasilense]
MKHAFSLVELSIVLVILGLLTGGILGGQALIRAAELRAVTTEFQRYVTATQTFRDKYFALPGDMNNASKFWGAVDPTPATCVATASTTAATCDGDGNGKVGSGLSMSESWHYWKQLTNAGLVEGNFNGIAGPANRFDALIGTNVPASRMANAGWTMVDVDSYLVSSPTYYFLTTYGNTFTFGSKLNLRFTNNPIMKPEEAWNIDTKIDDGKAVQGKLIAGYTNTCTTAAGNTDFAAEYALNSSATTCQLVFRNLF